MAQLENMTGYLEKKFKVRYSELGTLNYTLTSSGSYTQHMSFGGLRKPENDFHQFCKFLNKTFLSIHPLGNFAFTKNVLSRILEINEKRTEDTFNFQKKLQGSMRNTGFSFA